MVVIMNTPNEYLVKTGKRNQKMVHKFTSAVGPFEHGPNDSHKVVTKFKKLPLSATFFYAPEKSSDKSVMLIKTGRRKAQALMPGITGRIAVKGSTRVCPVPILVTYTEPASFPHDKAAKRARKDADKQAIKQEKARLREDKALRKADKARRQQVDKQLAADIKDLTADLKHNHDSWSKEPDFRGKFPTFAVHKMSPEQQRRVFSDIILVAQGYLDDCEGGLEEARHALKRVKLVWRNNDKPRKMSLLDLVLEPKAKSAKTMELERVGLEDDLMAIHNRYYSGTKTKWPFFDASNLDHDHADKLLAEIRQVGYDFMDKHGDEDKSVRPIMEAVEFRWLAPFGRSPVETNLHEVVLRQPKVEVEADKAKKKSKKK